MSDLIPFEKLVDNNIIVHFVVITNTDRVFPRFRYGFQLTTSVFLNTSNRIKNIFLSQVKYCLVVSKKTHTLFWGCLRAVIYI